MNLITTKWRFRDVAPFVDANTDRTMLPIRFISEAMGAKVEWDNTTITDSITLNGKILNIVLSQPLANGMRKAVLVDDRLFVPIRYVSEELGATVEWDATTKQVTIKM